MNMTNLILRLPAVKMRTGVSRSSIYMWIAKGQFPAPVSLGARAVGWVESEVDEWVALLSPDHQFYPQHEIEQSITSLNVCALRIRDGP